MHFIVYTMDAIAVGRAEVHWSTGATNKQTYTHTHSICLVYLHNRFVIIRFEETKEIKTNMKIETIKKIHSGTEGQTMGSKTIFSAICIIIMWRTGASMDFDHNNRTFV